MELPTGLEPATPVLQVRCSTNWATKALASRTGLEPVTFRLTVGCSTSWTTEELSVVYLIKRVAIRILSSLSEQFAFCRWLRIEFCSAPHSLSNRQQLPSYFLKHCLYTEAIGLDITVCSFQSQAVIKMVDLFYPASPFCGCIIQADRALVLVSSKYICDFEYAGCAKLSTIWMPSRDINNYCQNWPQQTIQ